MTTDTEAKRIWIPAVSREAILELGKRIKPVIDFGGSYGKCYIEPVDLFTIAYTWDPKRARKAVGLEQICDITTYHTWAYYGFFKPTISEVLAQIPAAHLEAVSAFEIIKRPENADDLNKEKVALNAGYHVAVTRLYRAKK
jgi:hypothetical protein